MRIRNIIKFLIFSLLFSIKLLSSFAQSEEQIKALFILKFTDYIEWNNFDDLNIFTIGIFDTDSVMFNEFMELTNGKTIKGKPIKLLFINSLDDLSESQILYINKKLDVNINQLINLIKGRNTLLITEIPDFNKSMINFVVVDNTVKFEMNDQLIANQNLIISPELKKLAIRSSDNWHELYNQSLNLLKEEREKVRFQEDELNKKKNEIEELNKKINEQYEDINKLENDIEIKELTLQQIAEEINKKYEILNKKSKTLKKQNIEIKNQQKKLKEQSKLIEKQKIDVIKQNAKLLEQKLKITSREKKIKKQEETLQLYLTKIQNQRIILILSIASIVAIIFLVFYIFRAYNIKKRANIELAEKNKAISNQKEEIEAQSEILEATNRELEKLSVIAKETDNAIVITDSKGNIQWINEGYTRLYGFTLDELKGDQSKNLIGTNSNLKIKDLINVWWGDKQTITYEALNQAKDGSSIWAQTTLTPLIDEDGNVKMLIGIDSDITKLKLAEKEVEKQKNKVEEKNNELNVVIKDLTDSLRYAKYIQNAIFPPEKYVKEILPRSFIFYQPKGIVSGDFYWVHKKDDNVFFAVVDCTGHGVPGAFMSIVGNNVLNQAITNNLSKPSDILNFMNEKVNKTLHQKYEESTIKDGMDIALCRLNTRTLEMEFSGALRPVYFIRNFNNNEKTKEILIETMQDKEVEFMLKNEKCSLFSIRGNKQPIGSFVDDKTESFTTHKVKLNKGDKVYLFSDGFADQFGGEKGKKYKYRRLNKLLLDIQEFSIEEQKSQIERTFIKWKSGFDQVDDVCFMGVVV